MGNIVLLDDLTINKIAAGEVIERPSSVVKEMIENSIDAGAKNITVEIKNGGITLIKITDDGCGIAEDDMEIAFERHATSKIRTADDLQTVKSMGFRGEALASIAAISKIEMISKKKDAKSAYKIVVEGGKTLEFTEAAGNVGTTIIVQNLFYNTPVRYKFLKKDYTEAGYIEDVVTRIALVNTNIAIKLISNGKTIVQTNGNGDIKTVIYSIYGKDIATELLDVDFSYENIRVTGVIGKPVIARGNRTNQLFFLNGRYIKDKNLTAATDQAYKGMIPVGRYGFIVLNLIMDPKLVDVNVHPAKLEVRFEDESAVFKAVYHAIKSNLAKSELVENVKEQEKPETDEKVNQIDLKEDNESLKSTEKEFTIDIEDMDNNLNKDEKKKKGISGLFQKILKEPEETAEELSNNHLEEIFKYRQILKNKGFGKEEGDNNTNLSENNYELKDSENVDKLSDSISKFDDENVKTINDDVINKKVELGSSLISSDTKEIDVNDVNNVIKDSTTEMLSTKFVDKQITQVLEYANMKKDDEDSSKIISNILAEYRSKKEKIENTDTDNNENSITKDDVDNSTQISETEINTEVENNENLDTDNSNLEKSSTFTKEPDNKSFASIAEKLVESKLGLDNTQMIDTMKVRNAIKEEKYEDNPEFDEMYKKTFGVDTAAVRKELELEKLEKEKLNVSNDFSYANENMNVFDEQNDDIQYKFIGIVFSTYIIIEIKNEMYIIDQHAAHERIMYEKVKANYYNQMDRDEQFLLLPDVISLTHKEMIIAKENIEMFNKAGFSFEEFGDNTIKLMSVPSMCEELNTKQLFLDILDEIDTVAVTARQEKEDKFIATIACKAAVKAKMKLDEQEVKSLMKKLLSLPNPFTCPHGRPTAIKMSKTDLEKKFSRR